MTDDIERRLRAALDAYANRVDDPGGALPRPSATSQHGGTGGRWRAAVLLAAAVVAVLGGMWGIDAAQRGGSVTAEQAVDEATPDSALQGTESAPDSADDDAAVTDAESYADAAVPATGLPGAPEVGVPYALDLSTHCGVLGTDVGGTWFAADPPLVEGPGNPPAGWGNPYQPGTLTLTSSDEGLFTDDAGHEVVLRAAPESARPAPCD